MSEKVTLGRRLLNGCPAIAARFGEVQTLVMLGLFYTLMIGPMWLISSVARRDLLHKRELGAAGTAWDDAESEIPDLERAGIQS